jgi:predicted nucleic acid-binding protein
MRSFPDTSFLCSFYRTQEHSPKVDGYLDGHPEALEVSSLLLLEFRQSIRLQIRLHSQDRTKGFSHHEGHAMLRDLQADLQRQIFQVVSVDWLAVHQLAEMLSAKFTEAQGHRLADILHVATALSLGAEEFLTFDAQQKTLALAEGMKVPW